MVRFIMIVLLFTPFLSGCIQHVNAWEKETLAKETMQEVGHDKPMHAFKEHVFFSKEASKGGTGVGGGGCGCN